MTIVLAICLALIILAIPLVLYLERECDVLQDALSRTERNLEYESALNLSLSQMNLGLETRIDDLRIKLSRIENSDDSQVKGLLEVIEHKNNEIYAMSINQSGLNKIIFNKENENIELKMRIRELEQNFLNYKQHALNNDLHEQPLDNELV